MVKKNDKLKPEAGELSSRAGAPEAPVLPAARGFLDDLAALGPLFLLGLAPLVFFCMGGEFDNNPKMAFLQWGIVLLAAVQLLRIRAKADLVWPVTAMDGAILVFYGFCLLSLGQAVNPYLGVLFLLHWAGSTVFYFFLAATLRGRDSMDDLFFITAAGVILVSLVGILQKLFGVTWIPQLVEPASTFSNKNMASQFIAMVFPLIIWAIVFCEKLWKKLICAFALFAAVPYVIFTQTRAAWIAIMAVCVVLAAVLADALIFRGRILNFRVSGKTFFSKKLLAVGAVLLAAAVMVLSVAVKKDPQLAPILQERFASIVKLESSSKLREIWWRNTLEMYKDHPWLGVGLDNFKLHYPLYHRAVEKDWSFTEAKQLNRVHNDHLQILVETGIFGFLSYAAMFFIFLWMFYRVCRRGDARMRLKALLLLLGVLCYGLIASLSFPLERAMPTLYLLILFACMRVLYVEGEPGLKTLRITSLPRRAALRICLAGMLAVLMGTSFYFVRRITLADYYFVKALGLGDRNGWEDANEALRKAKIFYMFNFNISALLARNYTMQEKYGPALEEYQNSLRAHPNNVNGLLNVGYVYLKLKQYDKAGQYFRRYLDIVPDSSKGHNNLGIALFSLGKTEQAEACYRKAIELHKGYAEAYFNLANLHRSQGKIQEATQEYEQALAIKPDMDEARQFLATMHYTAGNMEAAQKAIKPLIQKNIARADPYLMQGNIYQGQGKYKEAVEMFVRALQYSPKNAFIYHNIGLVHFFIKSYEKAEQAFKLALAQKPDLVESRMLLGQIYMQRKDDDSAFEQFQKALEIRPELSTARYNVATIYLRRGRLDEALQEYEKTVALDPGYSLAHYNLGALYEQKGRIEEAIAHFEKSLESPDPLLDVPGIRRHIKELKKKGLSQKTD